MTTAEFIYDLATITFGMLIEKLRRKILSKPTMKVHWDPQRLFSEVLRSPCEQPVRRLIDLLRSYDARLISVIPDTREWINDGQILLYMVNITLVIVTIDSDCWEIFLPRPLATVESVLGCGPMERAK